MHEKVDRYLDPILLEQIKSGIVNLLADCINSTSNSMSGDEVVDKISPTINRLQDLKQAILRELSGFHNSGLKELLSKNP